MVIKRKLAWILTLILSFSIIAQPVAADTESPFFVDPSVNDIQTFDPRVCITPEGSNTTLIGTDNQQKSYNFFIQKGLTPVQSAAIVGNLIHESDGLKTDSINKISGAYGIAQWLGSRKTKLFDFASKDTRDVEDLGLQLDFLWWELQDYESASLEAIKNETVLATNEEAGTGGAVEVWERKFERAGEHEKMYPSRYKYAKQILELYGNGEGTTNTSSTAGYCECGEGKVVVIDPGHAKKEVRETDPESGIEAFEYEKTPEMQDVWKVAQKVTSILQSKGYRVIMTKKDVNDSPGLIGRAKIANEAKADIAVSIHYDPQYGFNDLQWVTPQEVGKYRQTGSNKKVFSDEAIAKKSQEYTNKIIKARQTAEGGNVEDHDLTFESGRGLPAIGNISIVQLFSKVPWVFNEVGGANWNDEKSKKYAEGIANGIDSALGGSGALSDPNCTAGAGDAPATAMNYAWPEYLGPGSTEQKKSYSDAVSTARTAGKYFGGCDGNDCGGFVTRVMQNSLADPNYNDEYKGKIYKSNVMNGQAPYLRDRSDKYQLVGSNITGPSQLEQYGFAIAIKSNEKHTFMYIGKHDGFQTDRASASMAELCSNTRAPMAGVESFSGNRWYVLKK